ncbi:epsilon-sarcoglycan-like [Dendronephthya gigantea]|uniref:epsilon-sarcoglycan-like n=1 Tax=Dendronephthya gigantea TaxID=151771 RepID=UPI00106C0776|nr:epsilon-sarcoglycan-like [Dendronephthya gigantea]
MARNEFTVQFFVVLSVLVTFASADIFMSNFLPVLQRGYFMKYALDKKKFSPYSDLPEREVSFNFTTELDYPELPSWLLLEQRRASSKPFLYGAPGKWDESTKLEIIGWDKDNYTVIRTVQDVNINADNDFPVFQAEFFIKNKNLDEFLDKDEYKNITDIVKKYWSPDDLGSTMVISAIGHGGRFPLPDSNDHEGVIVRVGSSKMWPEANSSVLQPGKEPSHDYFKDMGYEINWSRFKWVDLRQMKSPKAEQQALLPPDRIIKAVSYSPPVFDEDARDFDIDFILIVIIPIIIIIIFVLILSLVMCFGREGRKKRDEQTPNLKLTHHHNIQRSTLRLRELSKPREKDSPPHPGSEDPSRPPHAHGEYVRLADDDDDRTDGRNAPPPYRMPPGAAGPGQAQQV